MNQEELIKSVENFYAECLSIVKQRNSKYSTGEDALFNVEQGALTAKLTVERALVHWISDKAARLSNLTSAWENGDDPEVITSIFDTLRDLAGYSALYNAEISDWLPENVAKYKEDDSELLTGAQEFISDEAVDNHYSPTAAAFEKFKSLIGLTK